MRQNQIALQLYTLREQAAGDLAGTLVRIAEIGYTAIEFAGLYNHAASDVRRMLDDNGLRAVSAHVPLADFSGRIDGVIEDMQTLGCEWAIVPWLPPELRGVDRLGELSHDFNAWGNQLADVGLRFAYHNHNFEFEEKLPDGTTLFQALIARTEPGTVSFELDVFWGKQGGFDPAAMLREHANRITLLHIKDADRTDPTRDTPFGEGALDWATILEAARAAGVAWYVVEQDKPRDAFADVETSLRNAEGLAE